ncbi:MAG TPA: AAA family ATPase, partial [Planctomycetaceae bacterium]|nr:AAA family ATPase [Planctomycetaceae bacterium]
MIVLSFINMKGGVAKTTLAVNVADCLRRRHDSRVLLVDVDPQFNATQCLMTPAAYVNHVKTGGATIVNVFDRQARPRVGVVDGSAIQEPRKLEGLEPVSTRAQITAYNYWKQIL